MRLEKKKQNDLNSRKYFRDCNKYFRDDFKQRDGKPYELLFGKFAHPYPRLVVKSLS